MLRALCYGEYYTLEYNIAIEATVRYFKERAHHSADHQFNILFLVYNEEIKYLSLGGEMKMFEKESETIRNEWSEYGRDTTLSVYVSRESQITEVKRDKAAIAGFYEYERKHVNTWL